MSKVYKVIALLQQPKESEQKFVFECLRKRF